MKYCLNSNIRAQSTKGLTSNKLKESQEMSCLEGCRPQIPRRQIRWMYGTAEEVSYSVVGSVAVGVCGVVGLAQDWSLEQ